MFTNLALEALPLCISVNLRTNQLKPLVHVPECSNVLVAVTLNARYLGDAHAEQSEYFVASWIKSNTETHLH